MQQVALRDAPDPRETRPPCYSDAIRMPRLDGFASLNELRNKHKNGGKENEEEDVPLRQCRCRSEEVLSMRETVRRSTRAPPRVHPFEVEQLDRQTFIDDDNEHTRNSNVILTLESSPGGSRARSKARKIQRSLSATESTELIKDFHQSTNSVERSPYSKRLRSLQPSSSNQVDIVDDHFKNETIDSESESDESEEFVKIDKTENKSENSSSGDIVIVNRPNDK